MTTNTNNTSVAAILKSNTSGVGKTTHLPELYTFEDNLLTVAGLGEFNLSDNIIRAKLVHLLHTEFKGGAEAAKLKTLQAMELDYLGSFHRTSNESAANGGAKSKANPISRKVVLTAEEYRENCIKSGLTLESLATVKELLATTVSGVSTKADLLELVESFKAVFLSQEQLSTYTVIAGKEAEDITRFAGLTEAGFTDIVRGAESITAYIPFDKVGEAVPQLATLGFLLGSSEADMIKMLIAVSFKELPVVD